MADKGRFFANAFCRGRFSHTNASFTEEKDPAGQVLAIPRNSQTCPYPKTRVPHAVSLSTRVPHAASLCIAGSARACPRESGKQVITTPWPPLLRGKASTQCRHIDPAKRISLMNRLLTEENLSLQVVFLKNLPLPTIDEGRLELALALAYAGEVGDRVTED